MIYFVRRSLSFSAVHAQQVDGMKCPGWPAMQHSAVLGWCKSTSRSQMGSLGSVEKNQGSMLNLREGLRDQHTLHVTIYTPLTNMGSSSWRETSLCHSGKEQSCLHCLHQRQERCSCQSFLSAHCHSSFLPPEKKNKTLVLLDDWTTEFGSPIFVGFLAQTDVATFCMQAALKMYIYIYGYE